MMPRIFQPDPAQTIYYAMGYGGNGVMYSAQAGRRMAQLIAGKGGELDLPIFTSPLPQLRHADPVPAARPAHDVPLVPPPATRRRLIRAHTERKETPP